MLTAKTPEELYEYGDEKALTKQFRVLASIHHPDKGGDAIDFALVKQLYNEALVKIQSGYPWESPTSVTWQGSIAKMRLSCRLKRKFELGTEFVGESRILYSMDDGNADMIENAVRMLKLSHQNLGPNDKLKRINDKLIPGIADCTASAKHPTLLIGKKVEEIPLKAVFDTRGAIPEVHIMWMIGRMMHLLCYLEWAGIVHGNITPASFYVNLEYHSLHLYGGWWYSALKGEKFKALPARTLRYVSAPYKAETRLDWELARQTVVELLGHRSPVELKMRKDLNPGIVNFLVSPWSAKSATDLYGQWEHVRDSFGPRKFVKFAIDGKLVLNDE